MMDRDCTDRPDYILVGGGLQHCLLALFLLHKHPDVRITLIEGGAQLGGNHTWAFHLSDVPPAYRQAVLSVLPYQWESYDVRFPAYRRNVQSPYGAIPSSHMHRVLSEKFLETPHSQLLLNTRVETVHSDHVVLSDGQVLQGRHVIDSRGLDKGETPTHGGFQKFVGLEILLRTPWHRTTPMLMDGEIAQTDGFRFMYVLPFAADRMLFEDTRFSRSAVLDKASVQQSILDYVAAQGVEVKEILRTEAGVLPMPYRMKQDWSSAMPLRGGYGAGFFHPATGYSFPVAARFAAFVASSAPEMPEKSEWDVFLKTHQKQFRFAAFLNRLLFTACDPEQRHTVFSNFYTLPEDVIERFYRMEMGFLDKARMFIRRPPRGFSWRHLLEGVPQP